MKTFGFALSIMFAAASAVQAAQPLIELGIPEYSGSGCPEGSVEAVLAPDNSSLSIIFDQYVVQAGGKRADYDPRGERQTCSFRLPAKAPKGYKIKFLQVDYRGFAEINKYGEASFTAEHLFIKGGRTRPVRTVEKFREGFSGEFLVSHPLSYYKSSCGGSQEMEFNTSLIVYARKSAGRSWMKVDEISMAGLDSADLSNEAPITVQFGLEKCD